jgi:hypothetical protein
MVNSPSFLTAERNEKMELKYKIGQIVRARFYTQIVNTRKEYRGKTIIGEGVVLFDEKEQCFCVESTNELPTLEYKTNGLYGTSSWMRAKSWYVQGHSFIKAKISDIID